jgi:hypothetical protein
MTLNYHLFVKEPGTGFTARSMSAHAVDLAAYGDFLIARGEISNYQVIESTSTDWQTAWVKGTTVIERSILDLLAQKI